MGIAEFEFRRSKKAFRPWLTTAVLAILLLTVAVLLVRLIPTWKRQDSPVTATRELANLKTLGHALRMHADEHDGKFPATIAGIEWRQNLPGLQRDGLPAAVSLFHDPVTGKEHRWIYYQGHSLSDSPDTILAAAPFPVGKNKDKRLIVRLNNVAEIINDHDFQKQISEQSLNMPTGL